MKLDFDRFHIGRFNLGRIIRFAIVGVANTGTYYVLYLLFHRFLPYLVAHTIAFVLAMIGSYFLNCYFTFRIRPTWKKFLLFPLSNAANYVITSVGLLLLVGVLHFNQIVAPLVAAVVAIPITYVVAQFLLVERERHAKKDSAEGHEPDAIEVDQLVAGIAVEESEVGPTQHAAEPAEAEPRPAGNTRA
ncbi:MAG TPA: GtrA family protein [Pseudonocardiaceae bacterium]|jgi:putative flippase GtrA|nr:GtrA family protein [Pseudonocardiaceae bacterium]